MWCKRLSIDDAQTGPAEPAKTGFSDEELGQIQGIVREAAQDTGRNDAMGEQFEAAEMDYDRIREIVREEVRRALEELVR